MQTRYLWPQKPLKPFPVVETGYGKSPALFLCVPDRLGAQGDQILPRIMRQLPQLAEPSFCPIPLLPAPGVGLP